MVIWLSPRGTMNFILGIGRTICTYVYTLYTFLVLWSIIKLHNLYKIWYHVLLRRSLCVFNCNRYLRILIMIKLNYKYWYQPVIKWKICSWTHKTFKYLCLVTNCIKWPDHIILPCKICLYYTSVSLLDCRLLKMNTDIIRWQAIIGYFADYQK